MSLINIAYADPVVTTAATTTAAAPHAPSMAPMLIVLAVIVLFYIWLWRQQSRKAKGQQQLINSLTKGDEVITSGGILGRVSKVEENFLTITIAKDIDIMVQKGAVASVLPKGTVKLAD